MDDRAITGHERIAALIPHQGGMCLWQQVLDWDEHGIQLRSGSHRDADNPLRSHGGLRARESGAAAPPGVLVALRGVQLHAGRIDDLHGDLECEAQVLVEGGSSQQYGFRISHAGVLLAEGRAAVMLQP